ncbi:hypothetical protein BJX76DRAFT_360724 [Aspergillus varians]
MSSTPEEKPQRATAAQLAARRIKDVRRRPRASGTPSSTANASFGGPFSSIDPNTVSSPSAGQQPVTNGFSFGQSQSFPPPSPTPGPPAQNGGSQFAFGSGGGSSAFNFSTSFGGTASTPASNPFASVNTGGASQQPAGGSFTGFKGNMFNVPSTGSQSPAQQSLPSSGGFFGTGAQQNGATGGLFGNTASSGPSSQPATTATANGNIFGQSTTSAASSNIFAQSGADKPNPFAQTTAFGNDSMQTSPDSKSTAQKPPVFGSGSSGFGVSTNFGSTGTPGNLFGGTTSAPTQTPSKPLFGAKPTEQAAPASSSLFGAATQPPTSASAAPSSSATPSMTNTASPSLFSTSTPKPATTVQNPFQSTNLFGTPTPSTTQKPSEEKAKEEPKASQSSINFPSITSGASLFSQSTTAAPAQSSGTSQPMLTGSLFAPKSTSTEQETPKPPPTNPFGNLFVPKPAVAENPQAEQKPSPSASNLFSPKPASSDGAKTSGLSKAATSTSPFSASTLGQPSSPAPQSPAFSISNPQAASPAPTFAPPTTSQSPFKVNGAKPATAPSSASSTPSTPILGFDKLQPAKMPSDLDKNTKEEVEVSYRVRLLNECFQREVRKLNPTTDSFDGLVQFFLRIRETIGAPVEGAGTKRKASADGDGTIDAQPSKKIRPFGSAEGTTPAIASSSNTTSSQLFGVGQSTPAPKSKRKTTEDNDNGETSEPQSAKRVSEDSTTANIFANSFSRSKTSESDEPAGAPSPEKADTPSFKASTPESTKPTFFSTTPTSSPPKPLFSASAAPEETSASGKTLSQPFPTFKPTFNAPASGTPPTNPFVLKPSGNADASASPAPVAIPKFGTGNTDFLAQFKAQSEKEAEKEKAKRKAEDFDSDEDDEEEWEREYAETQRKKREEIEAQQKRRAKFIPGQGFSFEDESNSTDEEKSNASPASSFLDPKPNSLGNPSNIFGHLSATPSESGDNEHDDEADDTEEASASGDDAARESSFAPTEDLETSNTDPKANGTLESSAPESSDEGDFTKALRKSKQTDSSDQNTTKEQGSGNRSLFDRVEYDQEGKPKRHGEDDKNISSLFGSSKFSSSFNSSASTSSPFNTSSKPQAEKSDDGATPKPAPTNLFGSSTPTANIFGGSSAASGAGTPSIFATEPSATKPGSDNTWKLNTPIKFASGSTTATESAGKSDSESAAQASGSANPFSTLFGAPSGGSKSGSNGSPGTLGFSFGGPSQQASSLLTPSVLTSEPQSRASTPGVTSDTGAESTDGDAPEALPQVDLARGGAGEENEDVVIETRARGLKWKDGSWDSQGVGYLRILKNQTTSRSRVLLRADPSGNVVLNALLMKEIKYTVNGNSIQFLVPQADGPPETWALRFKPGDASKIGTAMEENKS